MDRGIHQLQPTSGTTRFFGSGKVTVLAPAIGLRNRFDSYGVEINNASLSLMVETPASRYLEWDRDRRYVRRPDTNKLLPSGVPMMPFGFVRSVITRTIRWRSADRKYTCCPSWGIAS